MGACSNASNKSQTAIQYNKIVGKHKLEIIFNILFIKDAFNWSRDGLGMV